MIGSFVLLWVWFIAYKVAERAHASLPAWWHFFLAAAVALLVFVMVRRIKRLQEALHGDDEDDPMMPLYPPFAPPRNARNARNARNDKTEHNGKTP